MKLKSNNSIEPLTTKINNHNNLEIGGCDCVDLVQKYGTPLYIIDEETLRTACREYKNAFKNYEKTKFLYASKALCTSAILKIVSSEGFGFDTVSKGEIYTALNAGIDIKTSLFNGNNKTEDELEFAISNNIGRISADNFYELELLEKTAKKLNKKVDILLRITPGIECHTHEYIQTGTIDSKFGFGLNKIDTTIDLIKTKYKNINLKGLHAHVGSQIFELNIFKDEIEILIKEISRIQNKHSLTLTEINIGGGMGVKYIDNDKPLDVNEVAKTVISSIEMYCKKYNIEYPTLYIEPGRSIISPAGVTLYTAGSQKDIPEINKKYIALDGGMAANIRVCLYKADYTAKLANKPNNNDFENVTLCGRFCESGDVLIENIKLPKIETGDIICIFNTGSYNYSMSSNYNRVCKPAMVLVNSGFSDIIINRETFDDLIRNDVIPNRLNNV